MGDTLNNLYLATSQPNGQLQQFNIPVQNDAAEINPHGESIMGQLRSSLSQASVKTGVEDEAGRPGETAPTYGNSLQAQEVNSDYHFADLRV